MTINTKPLQSLESLESLESLTTSTRVLSGKGCHCVVCLKPARTDSSEYLMTFDKVYGKAQQAQELPLPPHDPRVYGICPTHYNQILSGFRFALILPFGIDLKTFESATDDLAKMKCRTGLYIGLSPHTQRALQQSEEPIFAEEVFLFWKKAETFEETVNMLNQDFVCEMDEYSPTYHNELSF